MAAGQQAVSVAKMPTLPYRGTYPPGVTDAALVSEAEAARLYGDAEATKAAARAATEGAE